MKRIGLFILPLVLVITAWEIISRTDVVSAALFPPPSAVFIALWHYAIFGTLFYDAGDSMWRLLLGLILGAGFGVGIGLLTGRVNAVSNALSPIIHVLRPLPPVAIIPLVIVWFGIDDGAKIFSIAFAVFFPVWINAHLGAQHVQRAFLWSANLLTKSPFKIFRKVIFPAALPFITAGIRTGISIAFVMVFVSELAGASSGIGYRISITQLSYRIDHMIAGLFVLGILGALTDQGFSFIAKKTFPFLKFSSK